MAIRYTPEFNKEIRRVVHNFNQKRNRAIKRGFHNLPEPLTVSELKSRYENKAQLQRDLGLLSRFNTSRDTALKTVETSGGAKAIKWEYDYLKKNLNYAKQYYDREIRRASLLDTDLAVTKREYLNNMKAKRDYLNLELSELSQSQFRTYRATINESLKHNEHMRNGYRGWMKEVETVMRYLGYDNKTINKFFEGFDELTPQQFTTMYRQNNLISRLYELYIPSKDIGGFELSTQDDDEARGLIDEFMLQKDEMIKRAKEEEQRLSYIDKAWVDGGYEKPKNKIPRSSLTPKQIQQLKDLHWDDLIE